MYVKQCVLKLPVKVTLACCFLFLLSFSLSVICRGRIEIQIVLFDYFSKGRVNDMNGIYARYNEQKNCIDVTVYEAGYILRLDCGKWEDGIKTTMNSQGRLDALAIDDPLEYVMLAMDKEMQVWVDAMDDDSVW